MVGCVCKHAKQALEVVKPLAEVGVEVIDEPNGEAVLVGIEIVFSDQRQNSFRHHAAESRPVPVLRVCRQVARGARGDAASE
jgi:hypothetical protein